MKMVFFATPCGPRVVVIGQQEAANKCNAALVFAAAVVIRCRARKLVNFMAFLAVIELYHFYFTS